MTPPTIPPKPPFDVEPVSSDVLACATQSLDPKDMLEQIQEIEAGRGRSLVSMMQIEPLTNTLSRARTSN